MIDLIGQLPAQAAMKFGTGTGLTFENRDFTFDEINILVERAASGLNSLGIGNDDVVTIYATNSWQYIISYYASFRVGAVVNPINAMLLPQDVEYIVTDCNATTIITSSNLVTDIVGLKDRTSVSKIITIGDTVPNGTLPFDQLLEHDFPAVPAISGDRDALSTICYTSGTTGKAKGVMLSHHAVLLNGAMFAQMHMLGTKDCIVSPLPLPHVFATVMMTVMMTTGMKIVLHPGFDPRKMLSDMEKYKATAVYAVPPMYIAMLNHPDLATTDLSSLLIGMTGAAPLPEALIEPIEAAFGIDLFVGFGMTELAGAGALVPVLSENPYGSAGVALPFCQMKIVDPADAEVEMPPCEPGELMFKGPVVMMGYLGREAETRETLRSDGWMHTGDIASIDNNGCVTLVDRKKDILIVGSSNVYPIEIEQVLATHSAVAQVAVGAQTHPVLGQVPKAYVMLKTDSKATEEELIVFCTERLASFKCPHVIQFVDDLPRNAGGKILRRKLKELDLTID